MFQQVNRRRLLVLAVTSILGATACGSVATAPNGFRAGVAQSKAAEVPPPSSAGAPTSSPATLTAPSPHPATSNGATATAAINNQVGAIDQQLNSLGSELNQANNGINTNEGDPTQ